MSLFILHSKGKRLDLVIIIDQTYFLFPFLVPIFVANKAVYNYLKHITAGSGAIS